MWGQSITETSLLHVTYMISYIRRTDRTDILLRLLSSWFVKAPFWPKKVYVLKLCNVTEKTFSGKLIWFKIKIQLEKNCLREKYGIIKDLVLSCHVQLLSASGISEKKECNNVIASSQWVELQLLSVSHTVIFSAVITTEKSFWRKNLCFNPMTAVIIKIQLSCLC